MVRWLAKRRRPSPYVGLVPLARHLGVPTSAVVQLVKAGILREQPHPFMRIVLVEDVERLAAALLRGADDPTDEP